ncbi:MAG: hypothetical protein VYA34_11885 [Myxococcota bacterium]|nr:hypothetical protein [Myxococcota bacterium]
MGNSLDTTHRFEPRRALKVPIILALIFWSIIALFLISEALLTNMELHPQSLIGLSFFLYLFGNRLRYYSQQMILVDMDGLIIMESGKLEAFSWNEVVGVEMSHPIWPGYHILTKRGSIDFSGFVYKEHQQLYDYIVTFSRKGALTQTGLFG